MTTISQRTLQWGAALSFSLLCGCGSAGLPQVMDARDVNPASGTPRIKRIRDIGTVMLPRTGAFEAISDGSASPGELLLVEGSGFGRQPTVTVGARAAEVLARVDGDGLVVRVPAGVDTGLVDVSVTTSGGIARLGTQVQRRVIALFDGRIRFVSVGGDGLAAPSQALVVPGARHVRVDSTGGIALVLGDSGDTSAVTVVDMGRTEPMSLGQLALSYRASALAVAALAPRVAAIGDGKLTIIDTSSLRRPVTFDTVSLPREAHGIRAAELSPDGKVLALLLADGNRVLGLDVSSPTAPKLVSNVEVLPGERQSLVRDMGFAPDGQTLWIIAGASAETHPQLVATRLTAVRLLTAYMENAAQEPAETPGHPIDHLRRQLAVWKTVTVPGVGAPLALYVGKAPDQQGSAIRTAPEAATVFLTAAKNAVFELKRGDADLERVRKAFAGGDTGGIARAELGGGGGPVATSGDLLGPIVMPAGDKRAVTLALHVSDAGVEVGLDDVRLDGTPSVRFLSLGSLAAKQVRPPFLFGDLAIQP